MTCTCGNPLLPGEEKCMKCLLAKYCHEPTSDKISTCPECGGIKSEAAVRCWECYQKSVGLRHVLPENVWLP